MSTAGKGIGTWADEVERAEAEEREHQLSAFASDGSGDPTAVKLQNFPCISEGGAAEPKKKKPTNVSLSEVNTAYAVFGSRGASSSSFLESNHGPSPDEILRLPTGPKILSAADNVGRSFSWPAAGGGRRFGKGHGLPPIFSDYHGQPSRAVEVDKFFAAKERKLSSGVSACGGGPTTANPQSFPSLIEGTAAKPKKKRTTMSLYEFNTNYRGPTLDEMLLLPTGPKLCSAADEVAYSRSFHTHGRKWGFDTSWPAAGGGHRFGEDHGPPPRFSDYYDQPSRADEIDNWAAAKKTITRGLPVSVRYDRNQSASLDGRGDRADKSSSWVADKKPPPQRPTFGSGSSQAAEVDKWVGPICHVPMRSGYEEVGGPRERPHLVLQKPSGDDPVRAELRKITRRSPFGAARPREEVLAEKGVDWRKLDSAIEARRANRFLRVQSDRPGDPAGEVGMAPKPKWRVNPFGDAKPREVVLEERGMDWRKMELEQGRHC